MLKYGNSCGLYCFGKETLATSRIRHTVTHHRQKGEWQILSRNESRFYENYSRPGCWIKWTQSIYGIKWTQNIIGLNGLRIFIGLNGLRIFIGLNGLRIFLSRSGDWLVKWRMTSTERHVDVIYIIWLGARLVSTNDGLKVEEANESLDLNDSTIGISRYWTEHSAYIACNEGTGTIAKNTSTWC